MGCAKGTVKYLLFFVNLVFALSGLALLVVGILYQISYEGFKDAVPDDFKALQAVPILTIVVGSIVFITAFLGCCGAIREGTCMLTLFAIILLSLFILKVAIGVYAFIKVSDSDGTDGIATAVKSALKDFVRRYENNDTVAQEVMDNIQHQLKCCGSSGPSDYTGPPPSSCCANYSPSSSTSVTCKDRYNEGCAEKFSEYLESIAKIIGCVLLGTVIVEFVSAIFALCLASSIRNESRRGRY